MKLDLEQSGNLNFIRRIGQTGIRVNDVDYNNSLIVTADHIIYPWQPRNLQELQPKHWQQCLTLQLDLIILGTGKKQQFPNAELTYPLLERGIGIEIMDTAAACRTFNIVMGDGRKVAAAIIFEQT